MTSEEYKEQLSEALGKLAGVHAVGDSWITFDGSIPAGGVPFTGQLVTRAMYADLWAWVQTNKTVVTDAEWQTTANAQNGMNAAYSSGDGSTTFRLPCAVGGYLCAGDTSTAGQYVKEGSPNIKGHIQALNTVGVTYYAHEHDKGALFTTLNTKSYASPSGSSPGVSYTDIHIDASRSSSVYRDDCQHVTPETFKVMVGVYAFGVPGTLGEVDKEGVVAELSHLGSSKADIDASNFSTAGKSVLAGMGMPSGRRVDLTLGASGAYYTAPANGWVAFCKMATAAFQNIAIFCPDIEILDWSCGSNLNLFVYAPVKKGDVFSAAFTADGQLHFFRFIYAEGATD